MRISISVNNSKVIILHLTTKDEAKTMNNTSQSVTLSSTKDRQMLMVLMDLSTRIGIILFSKEEETKVIGTDQVIEIEEAHHTIVLLNLKEERESRREMLGIRVVKTYVVIELMVVKVALTTNKV